MTLKALNANYKKAVKELYDDINIKIEIDKLRSYVVKNLRFDKVQVIKKKRISDIEKRGREIFETLKARIKKLKSVKQIPQKDLKQLENFLKEMIQMIDEHINDEKDTYQRLTRRKK